jgi:hypothetical protein
MQIEVLDTGAAIREILAAPLPSRRTRPWLTSCAPRLGARRCERA